VPETWARREVGVARRQLAEIIDQPWCPTFLREGVTAYLQLLASLGHPFGRALPHLRAALEASKSSKVVDLGSGVGGPWLKLQQHLEREVGSVVDVTLTDLHPEELAKLRVDTSRSSGALTVHPSPVDARSVPMELDGFRTLFSTFHHFSPEEAREVLADAVARRQGIAIFEMTHRSLLAVIMMLLTPCMAFWVTPFIKPFKWTRLLFTYLIPVIPLVIAFDGVVSCLRTSTPKELLELAESCGDVGYRWEAMQVGAFPPSLIPITMLIGVPSHPSVDSQNGLC
jgi:hypothetical protein